MDRIINCWQRPGLFQPNLPATTKETNMRNRIGLGIMGLALVLGLRTADAQDTNAIKDWVQTANYALTAQVQTGEGTVQTFAITSKVLIQYLRGASITNQQENTVITTNGTGISVTNASFLPNHGAP